MGLSDTKSTIGLILQSLFHANDRFRHFLKLFDFLLLDKRFNSSVKFKVIYLDFDFSLTKANLQKKRNLYEKIKLEHLKKVIILLLSK